MSAQVDTDKANESCVGPSSEEAGKAEACAGCPNAAACASGAGRVEDPTPALVQDALRAAALKTRDRRAENTGSAIDCRAAAPRCVPLAPMQHRCASAATPRHRCGAAVARVASRTSVPPGAGRTRRRPSEEKKRPWREKKDRGDGATHHHAPRRRGVKHVILVLSGKGGVGKSTVSCQLAMAGAVTKPHGAFKIQVLCAQRGARVLLNISAKFRVRTDEWSGTAQAMALASKGQAVGLLDIDICGPSVPRMLGLRGRGVHRSSAGWSPVFVDAPNDGELGVRGPAR